MTALSDNLFHELSTDVYDEIIRRNTQNEGASNCGIDVQIASNFIAVRFIRVRMAFNGKRNKALQRMAKMPDNRLRELSSEIYFEIERRYPELKYEVSKFEII